MVVAERARGWLRAHPTGADALLAVLVFAVSLGPLLFEPSGEHVDLTPFAVVLLAGAFRMDMHFGEQQRTSPADT